MSPTFTSWKKLFMCCRTFRWATWYLFASNFKYATTSIAFWIFRPQGLISFFCICCSSKTTAPCPKNYKLTSTPQMVVRYNEFGILWYKIPHMHSKIGLNTRLSRQYVALERTFQHIGSNETWRHAGHIGSHDSSHW
jgi:hypothetical protein